MNRFYDALPTAFFDDAPVCIIVGAGDLGDYEIAPGGDDLVIAADGGYRYLQAAGVRCDLLMGDLDSLPPDTVIGTETRRYNPIKDDTDTMLAVRHGLSLGYRKFLLFGMFGGRFDHTVGTLQTVAFLAEAGAAGYAFEQTQDGRCASYITAVKDGTLTFSDRARGYLSLAAWGGDAHGVTLEHLKYPLCEQTLQPHVALGISNEFLPGETARVTVRDGLLLVVKPL
ncbi:MAG: thiamine diphosphokinase [Ruminococcaceae bacterium]|nr:thiamine diphosphokinase [Oscillospiraceae bacterium]